MSKSKGRRLAEWLRNLDSNSRAGSNTLADDSVGSDQLAHDLALQGNPTAATQSTGNNSTRLATTAFVATEVAALVDSAPGTLNTLNELAAALGDDENFSTTVTNSIATKAPLASPALTGTPTAPTASAGTNTTQLATTAFVTTAVAGATIDGISTSADATAITIDSNENVGIGNTAPYDVRVHISGDQNDEDPTLGSPTGALIVSNTDTAYGLQMGVSSDGTGWIQQGRVDGTATAYNLNLQPVGGNVGIGTTSPVSPLEVKGSTPVVTANSNVFAASGNGTGFGIYRSASGRTAGYTWTIENVIASGGSSGSDYQIDNLVFKGRASTSASSLTERMRINSSGDVSIGSSSNHAGARVVINDTPPTAFGSPMFQVGQETFTSSGIYSIGFGYTAGSYTEPPAEIAAVSTSSSGGTTADIVFGTRSVTTNTAVTERMRIDASGNVGIGATSLVNKLTVNGNQVLLANGELKFADAGNSLVSSIKNQGASGTSMLAFLTGSTPTERMRVTQTGDVLISKTATNFSDDGIELRGGGDGRLYITNTNDASTVFRRDGSNGIIQYFYRANSGVGNIAVSTTATAYNTSSDERLKENITDASAGNIDDIRVRSFDWKVDGSHQPHGMIAQELVDVAPEAVSQGETKDEMWSVDYSKLVPMMIKEIQDLKAKVTALENGG
tara:strand:+ start:599 stop:2620 length:2022 start_codon:yes stop_codon:yes gene_type:complete